VPWLPSPPPSLASTLHEAKTKLTLNDTSKPQEYIYVHCKGAAPTWDPFTQQQLTLLPLPRSRGTPTLILSPTLLTSTSWGLKKNALSLAHGADRSMSRAKRLTFLLQKYKGQDILVSRGGDADGTWVVCDEKDLVFEEAPDAYKDVQAAGQDLVDAGVAQVLGWRRARVSYKVRNEERSHQFSRRVLQVPGSERRGCDADCDPQPRMLLVIATCGTRKRRLALHHIDARPLFHASTNVNSSRLSYSYFLFPSLHPCHFHPNGYRGY
jgi:hypothetical protein